MTLNLNGGGVSSAANSSSAQLSPASASSQQIPTTPKLCNLPSAIPLIPTPIEKNVNKNESVTVTHFSDLHGGVVEKISVPVTSGSTSIENDRISPKMEFSTTRTSINSNNPFATDEILTTTITTTSTTMSPAVKISTNPFHTSFSPNDSNASDKSVKISFSILGGDRARNPFESDVAEIIEANEIKADYDDVDNERNLSSISSINLKIDKSNDSNVTTIKMDNNNVDKQQQNGTSTATILAKKNKNKVKIACSFHDGS